MGLMYKDSNGIIHSFSSAAETIAIPTASKTQAGVVKIGNNLSMDENGFLSADAQEILLDAEPTAESTNGVTSAGIKAYVDNAVSGLITESDVEDALVGLASEEYVTTAIEEIKVPVDTVLKEGGLNAIQGRTVANNLKKIDRYNEPIITQPTDDKYIMSCNLPFINSEGPSESMDFGTIAPSVSCSLERLWYNGNGAAQGGTLEEHFTDRFFAETGYTFSQATGLLSQKNSTDPYERQAYNLMIATCSSAGYHFFKGSCRENGYSYDIWWYVKDSPEFDAGVHTTGSGDSCLRLILGEGTVFYYVKGGVNGTGRYVYKVTKTGLYSAYNSYSSIQGFNTLIKPLTSSLTWNEGSGYYYTPLYNAHYEDAFSPYQKGTIINLYCPVYHSTKGYTFEETFATTYEEANPHDKAIDGTTSTYWGGVNALPTTSDGNMKDRWYCKLNKACSASSISITLNAGISLFDIQASKDGIEWVTIQTHSGATSDKKKITYTFSGLEEYQYYGVAFYSKTAEGTAHLYEFAINHIEIIQFQNPLFNINSLGDKVVNGLLEAGNNYELVFNGESWDISNTELTNYYTKHEIDQIVNQAVTLENYYTKSQVEDLINNAISNTLGGNA